MSENERATTSDFSPEGLQMIIDLMLAQAQALYYNKCHETAAASLRVEMKP